MRAHTSLDSLLGEVEVLEPNVGLHALSSAVGQAVALLLRDGGRIHVGQAGLHALGRDTDLVRLFHLLVEHVADGFLAAHR